MHHGMSADQARGVCRQRRKEREALLAEQEEEARKLDPEFIKEQERREKEAKILALMRPKGKGA